MLSTASVKYACLYRKYFSFGLGGWSIGRWIQVCFPGVWSRCLFVSSRTCEWKVSSFWLWKKQTNNLQHLNVHVHRAVHEMLAYCVTSSLLQFDNDEFSFLMTNIYEYIHYIQSLKSIWTKRMSTWGCYFCCVCVCFSFLFFFFFFFFSVLVHYRHVKCVYFLRKYWMYSKKKKKNQTRNPCWYQIFFFFLRRFQKMKTKYTKKSQRGRTIFFIYTVEKKKKILGWKQLNTLPLQFWSYKWWLRIKRTDSFDSILELWLFTSHMDICGCSYFCLEFFFLQFFFFFFFVPTRGWGLQAPFCHIGHWEALLRGWDTVAVLDVD